jgi:hypothetical protein
MKNLRGGATIIRNFRTDKYLLWRRKREYVLHLKGKTIIEIAKKMRLSKSTIEKDLRIMRNTQKSLN